jgi:hypothetical protein
MPYRAIRNFYGQFERPISSVSLVLGFAFDALTLKRVDTLWENLWIVGHLVIVSFFIALIHLQENEVGGEKNPSKAHFWYVNILQFFFGGILSTYLVFYFRSGDILVTWPFLFLLALAFIANESLKRHYMRLSFQITLLFLSIYSFAIFLIPVVLHKIGALIFLLSGLLSMLFISLFILILYYFIKDRFTESKKLIFLLVLGIFMLVNILYFTNLIPPIPLSLKEAGIYHSIQKISPGNYIVTYEDYGWRGFFTLYPDFRALNGTTVYAYGAIFSPVGLNITILDEWQHYDTSVNKWVTAGVISLPVVGGRAGGFRTYSSRSNLAAGKWRVNVKTSANQVIGQLRFNIIPVDTEPTLTTMVN